MTDEEIQNIITEFENRNQKEKAFFGFYQYGGGIDESGIRANRKGIELFTAQLLKSTLNSEKHNYSENEFCYSEIDIDWTDDDSDFFFDSIEITNKDKLKKDEKFPRYKRTISDRFYEGLIFLIILLLILFLFVGFVTIVKWIF
ncbi:hypothetical protein [uncultured Aquimarina sp.]|uniref:hypothetical protein n=1 Tax=uncultured Aquimarina sp. TaxID=575652 RepID=UPI00262E83C7|nr:hypothetical protein [uncultured Aquimarina sp.]